MINPATGARRKYGELADAVAKLPTPENVALKDPKNFTLIGTPAKRIDTPEKGEQRQSRVRHRCNDSGHEVRDSGGVPGFWRQTCQR